MLLGKDVGPKGSTCALLLVAGLFIDSQSLVGDGVSFDLAMVEARRLFQRLSMWR
jgi:hypothetical protein